MPKPIKLTAPALDALRPTGKREDYRFAKRAAPNLVLRSSAAGSLTWTYVAKVAGSNYRATFGPVRRLANGKVDPANVEEARAWAANQRAAVQSGVNVLQVQRAAKGVPTLGDVWEEFRAGRSRGKAASSQAADLLKWETYIRPELGQMKVDAIDRANVKGFLDRVYSQLLQHKQFTNGSRVNDIRALLSTLFTVAVQAGHVDVNPVQAVPAFKIAKRDRKALTDAQRAALLSAAHSHSAEMGLIVLIALTTGLRLGNVLGMRWEYLDGSLLTFPASAMKGKRDHVVRLPETLQARLGEWREREALVSAEGHRGTPVRAVGWVFPSTATKHVNTPEHERPARSSIKTAWGHIREAAGLPDFTFHGQRHDFATAAARDGASQYDLQRALGHSDYRMTAHYINAAAGDGAAEIVADRAAKLAEAGASNVVALPRKEAR